MERLFRALISRDHVERWRRQEYTSFHHIIPGAWMAKWQESGSRNPADYSLRCSEGTFTERARGHFLRLAAAGGIVDRLTIEEKRKVSELAGVCAFTEAAEAYQYGMKSWVGGHALFVEFDGEVLCAAPENRGVVARVMKVIAGPLGTGAFSQRNDVWTNPCGGGHWERG